MSDPRPATTVLLLRPAEQGGLAVFMVQRHRKSGFMPNAWVFPGGRVDDADRLLGHDRVRGGQAARERLELPDDEATAYLVAGVRETFEEAGIWLGSGAVPESERPALQRGDRTLAHVLETHDVTVDLDRLHPWSRWVTPQAESRRYDTRFLVASCGDEGVHCDIETVDSGWFSVAELLRGAAEGRFPMAPPTWWSLHELAAHETPEQAVEAARRRPQRPIQPLLDSDEQGVRLLLPGHPDHPQPAYDGLPTCVRFVQGRWWADGAELPGPRPLPKG